MFLNFANSSVNSPSDLSPGTYRSVLTCSRHPTEPFFSIMVEYGRMPGNEIQAIDLLIKDPDGDVYFRDFVLCEDQVWRDCDGKRDNDLLQLLPPGYLNFIELEVEECAPVVVKAGNE